MSSCASTCRSSLTVRRWAASRADTGRGENGHVVGPSCGQSDEPQPRPRSAAVNVMNRLVGRLANSVIAMLAIEVAARIAGHIRGLVLVGGTPRFISEDPRRGWPPRLFERMKRKMDQDVSAAVAGFQAGMFATGEELEAEAFRHQRSCHEGWSVDALLAGLDYLIATDLTERLEAVACPVLWIHGGADTICPPGAIAQVPRRHHCHVMPNAGHLPAWTRSQEVADTIRSFIENDA